MGSPGQSLENIGSCKFVLKLTAGGWVARCHHSAGSFLRESEICRLVGEYRKSTRRLLPLAPRMRCSATMGIGLEVDMSEANKALAKRWFEEVWNEGRKETIGNSLLPKP